MAKRQYREGDVFLIPLRDSGFGLGVISRIAPRGGIVFGYFFGPRIQEVPSSEWSKLNPSAAVAKIRFGDLHLIDERWQVIGQLPKWNRQEWPMPQFLREDPLRPLEKYIVSYDPDDPSLVLSETAGLGGASLDRDALCGAGAVEIRLTKYLANGTVQNNQGGPQFLMTAVKYLGWLLCWSSLFSAIYIAFYLFVHRAAFGEGQSAACELGVIGSAGIISVVPGTVGFLIVLVVKRIKREPKFALGALYLLLLLVVVGLLASGSMMKAQHDITC